MYSKMSSGQRVALSCKGPLNILYVPAASPKTCLGKNVFIDRPGEMEHLETAQTQGEYLYDFSDNPGSVLIFSLSVFCSIPVLWPFLVLDLD